MKNVPKPTLVVVCGRAGTGKTTLAHRLARAIPCPAICRDEIKEGMVHATPGFVAGPGDALTQRTFPIFFDVIRLLVSAGVTLVAEAAFTHDTWEPQLQSFSSSAHLRIVRCRTDPTVRLERVARRGERIAHADRPANGDAPGRVRGVDFEHLAMSAPTLDVHTTTGYHPPISDIIAFVNALP